MKALLEFKIDQRIIAAMAGIQSRDGFRAAIGGIHFECRKGSVTLVATDGKRMGVYYHMTEVTPIPKGEIRFTINADAVLKLFAKTATLLVELLDGAMVSVRDADGPKGSAAIVVEDLNAIVSFPKWRHVIPTTRIAPQDEFSFDPELLKPFLAAGKLLGQGKSLQMLAHESNSKTSKWQPYSVYIPNAYFYGVLMPCRSGYDNDKPEAPEWARPIPEPTPAPAPEPAPAPAPAPATQ